MQPSHPTAAPPSAEGPSRRTPTPTSDGGGGSATSAHRHPGGNGSHANPPKPPLLSTEGLPPSPGAAHARRASPRAISTGTASAHAGGAAESEDVVELATASQKQTRKMEKELLLPRVRAVPTAPGGAAASSSSQPGELSEGSLWGYGGQQSHSSEKGLYSPPEVPQPIAWLRNREEGSGRPAALHEDAARDLLGRLRAVQTWADGHRRARGVTAPAPFAHTLGIVNPASGENAAAGLVLRGMRAELGAERVLVLDKALFATPDVLRKAMQAQAFCFHDPPAELMIELAVAAAEASVVRATGGGALPAVARTPARARGGPLGDQQDTPGLAESTDCGSRPRHGTRVAGVDSRPRTVDARPASAKERGTVIISGGDGTVSFVMNQVHLARRELEAELRQLLRPDVPLAGTAPHELRIRTTESDGTGAAEGGHGGEGSSSCPHLQAACARLLDGTSYFTMPAVAPIPMGTGNDFSNCVGFGSGFTRHRGLGMCCCLESDVGELLRSLVAAPSTPFDRWTADFVPLRVAQENLRPGQGLSRPRDPNTANAVHLVDWERLRTSGGDGCASFTITNYLGIGFDAFVTTEFAKARESYPGLCSTRMQNKTLYGVLGVHGGVRCRTIRSLIPMVCVPNPWASAAAPCATDASPPSPPRSEGRPDMVALKLPSSAKALVMTNVSCYSSGTKPWKPKDGELYYRPVELSYSEADVVASSSGTAGPPSQAELPQQQQDEGRNSIPSAVNGSVSENEASLAHDGVSRYRIIPARAAVHRAPIITPVAINDSKFELQAMGGVLSYAALTLGLTGSTKMTQAGEMFIFALCTPDDLYYERGGGLSSPYSRKKVAKYAERLRTDARVRASLNVQIDGEAIPRITEPTIVHVYPMARDRIHVRCRNPEVVRRTLAGEVAADASTYAQVL